MSDHATTDIHDEHGHAPDTLGPIDWKMWGAGVVGVIAGLLVVASAVVATGFVFFDKLG